MSKNKEEGVVRATPLLNNQNESIIQFQDFKLAEKEKNTLEILDKIKQYRLLPTHKIESDYIIPHALKKGKICIFYAEGGVGKTFAAWGISKYAYVNGKVKEAYYFDADNSLDTNFERNVHNLLVYANFYFINHNNPNYDYIPKGIDLLKFLISKPTNYTDVLFVFDSLKDFIGDADTSSDKDMRYIMNFFMDLRKRGASIIIIHHSLKKSTVYKGAGTVKDSADTMYLIECLNSDTSQTDGFLDFKFIKEKARDGGENFNLRVDVATTNVEISNLNILGYYKKRDLDLIEKIENLIKQNYLISHNQIFKSLKKHPTDKKVIKILSDFTNIKWFIKVKNRRKFYYV